MSKLRFTMPFEPMAIEHLGLRLYSTLPPVINEFVTNAYDAESPKVEITLPQGRLSDTSEVIIRDYGHGLSAAELQNEFLPIGRNRRGPDSSNPYSRTRKRRVTGRKGLGKLSGLGVANEMIVWACQGGTSICLKLRYDQMRNWSLHHPPSEPYEPEVVAERTGPSKELPGLEIRLRELRRRSPINETDVSNGLARRLRLLDNTFTVLVNGRALTPAGDIARGNCEISWDLADTDAGSQLNTGHEVRGWIGFAKSASQRDRGIDIFASGKSVEIGSFFNYPSTHAQFARAHLVGEVYAEFLDDQDQDLASTARNSVVWESDLGHALEKWGQELLAWAFAQWLENRRKQREDEIVGVGKFDEWLNGRTPQEQRVARRLVKIIAKNDDLAPGAVSPLLEIVKASVETIAFNELVDAMDENGATIETLLRLFEDWRVIEAREHLKLADGRVAVIERLETFIENGALEVKEIQPLLVHNLWLLDPGWSQAMVQPTYTKMLREQFKEPRTYTDKDRRLDIVGVTNGARVTVVEIKRPENTLLRDDLEQIERYTDWMRMQVASQSGADAAVAVDGLLLVGNMGTDGTLTYKVERLAAASIRVQTYREIHWRAGEYFRLVEQRLKDIAPEYSRTKRRARRAKV